MFALATFFALSLCRQTATFAGGSVESFAKFLNETYHTPVVISTSRVITVPALSIDVSKPASLSAALKTCSLFLEPNTRLAISDQRYADETFINLFTGADFGDAVNLTNAAVSLELPASILKDGLVSFDSSGSGLATAATLKSIKWKKPFSSSSLLFGKLSLAVVAKDVPEKDFVNLVKSAIGGEWFDADDGGRVLRPSALQIRIRAEKTLDSSATKFPPRLKAARELYLALLGELDDEALIQLFSEEGGHAQIRITAGNAVEEKIVAYIQAAARVAADQKKTKEADSFKEALDTADNRKPIECSVSSNGEFELKIWLIDATTNQPKLATIH